MVLKQETHFIRPKYGAG